MPALAPPPEKLTPRRRLGTVAPTLAVEALTPVPPVAPCLREVTGE